MTRKGIEKWSRREFLEGLSATTLAAAAGIPMNEENKRTTLKMVQTESLDIGYEETGPESGYPIVLLHGWPYDVRSYDDVRGPLADAGYRVIVPYLRCFGPTIFRSAEIFRSGQQSAFGKDIIDLRLVTIGWIWRTLTLWGIRSDEISCAGHAVNGHLC